jgi:hypothetical protein
MGFRENLADSVIHRVSWDNDRASLDLR